jgi:hypothetical protein
MKVLSFKEFDPQVNQTLESISKYLAVEMSSNLREMVTILKKLTFTDNFESFEISATIEPTEERAIRNEMRGGIIPSKRMIVRGDTYSPYIVDGDTAWTRDYLYLKNTHATQAATVTVLFLK